MTEPLGDVRRVLFMQSQPNFGSDSQMHSLIYSNLDRERFEVHVACNSGEGGVPSVSLATVESFDDLHVRPTKFGPSINSLGTESRFEVLGQVLSRGPAAVVDLVKLVAYARRNSIDIIHGTEKPRDALYGHLLARLSGAKSITHLHVKSADWISKMTRWAMQRNDALIGVSQFVCDSYVDFGYEASKVYPVLNALDIPAGALERSATEHAAIAADVRAEFGVDPSTPLLLIASRLFPWKGHDELLVALHEVQKTGQPFHLLIAGKDDPRATPDGGSYSDHLRDKCDELGLSESVTLTGFRTDVSRLMDASDIYVMPSFEEPCAVVYLEAMAHGKAIVALENGGTQELVANGETGLLSDPWDTDTLAKNLMRLMRDPQERVAMGRAGRERLLSHFTPARMAADTAAVYESMLARSG